MRLVSALVACGLAACGGDSPTLILSIGSPTPIASLEVFAKQYFDDGSVALYPSDPYEITADMEGYVLPVGDDPLQMRIDLPGPGRYAVHLVGVPAGVVASDPAGDRYVSTVCAEVTGVALRDDVVLGRLTRGPGSLDVDGDTFPEDAGTYCAIQAGTGYPCDDACRGAEFLALADCNPLPEFVLPAGCDGPIGDDAEWNPFVPDLCGDCLDHDCYGGDARCLDRDEDGYPGDLDCDDHDPAINPGTPEVCGNGIDENCRADIPECTDGDVPCDGDRDGYVAMRAEMEGCGQDCDDAVAAVSPIAYEGYGSDPNDPTASPGCGDGIDNNCNGRVDERCTLDLDDDGVERSTDCNDCNAAVGQGLAETCGNGLDEDCDGRDLSCDPNDADGDGVSSEASGGADCDDSDATVHAGAADYCGDGITQDCSLDRVCGAITDADGDRFAADGGDCDDSNPGANPWATEVCDEDETGTDEDCDGVVNEVSPADDGARGCGFDEDGDRLWEEIDYATDIDHCGRCHHECVVGSFHREGDACVGGACTCFGAPGCAGGVDDYCCEDGCQAISTDPEHCGGCDARCVRYEECVPDEERSGLGECLCRAGAVEETCDPLLDDACCPGVGCTSTTSDPRSCGDCDNDCSEPAGRPRGDLCAVGGSETAQCYCGAIGTVCSGTTWCTNADEPGGGCGCHDLDTEEANCGACGFACDLNEQCEAGRCLCPAPANVDCGDSYSEACCPGIDHCVDLGTDENNCGGCGIRCYAGEECVGGTCECTPTCSDGNDCTEDYCEGGRCIHDVLDRDDDGWCGDGCDGEGEGSCTPGDCDDGNASVHPDRTERCSTTDDDDCDGDTNDLDAEGCTTYYRDVDDDTYGDSSTQCRCRTQGDYTASRSGDCNDGTASVNPGAPEICDDIDNDCDSGTTDDGEDECSGGAGSCCGTPHDCRTCCTDSQCPGGTHADCTSSFTCSCQSGWTTCGGGSACACNTGYEHCCSGSSCIDTSGSGAGTGCCTAADCGGTGWSCSGNTCSCSGVVCSGTCYPSGECCSAADCGSGTWACNSHVCQCSGVECGSSCYSSGECCDDGDCPSSRDHCNTSSHLCECDPGWSDCGGTCNCNTDGSFCCESGSICLDTSADRCCSDADCSGANTYCNDASDTCVCDSGWTSCGGTCNCFTGGGYCCDGATCVHVGGGQPGDGCCDDGDCSGGNTRCNTVTNTCECDPGWTSCGGTCNCFTGGGNCCNGGICWIPGAGDYGDPCCEDSDCWDYWCYNYYCEY